MFQTELIHYLQSYESSFLTQFMRLMTALGYRNFIVLFLAVMLFGIEFRKGFIIMQGMLWTALITTFFKDYFALPRPYHVDSTVKLLDGGIAEARELNFERMGSKSLFGFVPESVTTYYRNLPEQIPYGFPSGHTSMAVILWGTTVYLFRPLWVKITCFLFIIFVPLSRMYLGVHFLADVIGGYIIGLVMFWLLYQLILKPKSLQNYLTESYFPWKKYPVAFLFLLLTPPSFLFFIPDEGFNSLGTLWGMNIAFFYLAQRGLPYSQGSFLVRLGRVAMSIALFIGSTALLSRILPSDPIWKFIGGTLAGLFFIGVTTEICLRIKLFSLEKASEG
jgi:membrane-associated phospholipid phosphatase